MSTFVPLMCFILISLTTSADERRLAFDDLLKDQPYWRIRTDIFQKVLQEHMVPVSVVRSSQDHFSSEVWSFRGGGLVQAPLRFVWKTSQQFEKLKLVHRYFKRATYDPTTHQLFVHLMVFGIEKELTVEVQAYDGSSPYMTWVNREGWYKGMYGVLQFSHPALPSSMDSTLVSMVAFYESSSSGLNWLTSMIAEALMQSIAISLRKGLEEQYQEVNKQERRNL